MRLVDLELPAHGGMLLHYQLPAHVHIEEEEAEEVVEEEEEVDIRRALALRLA